MAQDSMAAAAQFRVGRVMGDSAKVLGRNFVPFIVLSFICGLPNIVITALNPDLQRAITGNFGAGEALHPFSGDRLYLTLLGWVIGILCYSLNQSALVFGTVQDLQGRRVGLGAIVSRGFASLLPVIGAAFLMTLGLMVGFALLIVPGFILILMWWVTIPVIVVERSNITAAFGRSRQLTAGHRWAIFGMFMLFGVIQEIVTWAVASGFGRVFGAGGNIVGAIAAGAIAALLIAMVFSAYFAVMTAVGYYYLRAEKEGIVIDDIARVFD